MMIRSACASLSAGFGSTHPVEAQATTTPLSTRSLFGSNPGTKTTTRKTESLPEVRPGTVQVANVNDSPVQVVVDGPEVCVMATINALLPSSVTVSVSWAAAVSGPPLCTVTVYVM